MQYPWLSVLPPLIAIGMAIATRQVLLSLGMSIVAGAVLLVGWGTEDTPWLVSLWQSMWSDHLWPALTSSSHQQVFLFSLTLGAMVGVIEATGGMQVLVRWLTRLVRTRRSGQGLVWFLGLAIFFDDYANTLLLGSTMRSAADRLRFSRAKLAYLVDSTAAPVAGLALISTWVATEISLIGDGLAKAGVDASVTPFSIFLESIPYRFYAILALVMVALVAFSGRDFGSMLTEEERAGGAGMWAGNVRLDRRLPMLPEQSLPLDRTLAPWFWVAAVVPVVVCVAVVVVYLVISGKATLGPSDLTGLRYWGEVFGNGDSYTALVRGSLWGLATAILFGVAAAWSETRHWAMGATGLARWTDFFVGVISCLWGAVRGALHLVPAMMILWLAWSLSSMTEEGFLNTGGYLESQLKSSEMPSWLLPTAVFVTSGFVALSTGTSWGTMAVLTPLSVQLAVSAGASQVGSAAALADGGPLLLATVGAVLAGAIFGDHCSPISDTTVLSSRASGCDHILHVRTQLPYALSVGLISILAGTIPAGLGLGAGWALLVAILALIVLVFALGRVPHWEGSGKSADVVADT